MNKPFSFEFFPPQTEKGRNNLKTVVTALAEKQPEFFSVTYGAGGSTKDRTFDTVADINAQGLPVAPHLSFGIDGEKEVGQLLEDYKAQGVKRIVALRGDIPADIDKSRYTHYASDLIRFIRSQHGDHFHIEVACYPEIHPDSNSFDSDISFFKSKVDEGADSAITQYFYNADSYFYYLDACQKQGINIPIFPGIMPILNYQNLVRFSDGCGAEIPRWIRQRLESYGDDIESIKAFGEEVVSRLCEQLISGGAPGLHFYTMNQSEPSLNLLKNIS